MTKFSSLVWDGTIACIRDQHEEVHNLFHCHI